MTDQELKCSIEIAKNIIRGMNNGHHDLITADKLAILNMISTCQSVLDAQGALPEKLILNYFDGDPDEVAVGKLLNAQIDKCALRLAKRLDGLEEVIAGIIGIPEPEATQLLTAIREYILGGKRE